MDIDTIIGINPDSILIGIAGRVKERRLERNLTQKAFAKRVGVGYDAYRNLRIQDGFADLFTRKSYQSIDDLLKTKEAKKRKRGSRNE